MKRLVIDLDGTLTVGETSDYSSVKPNQPVVDRLRDYHKTGFEIVLHTARNMRTHNSNVGRIVANTVPTILNWLELHGIPYDEIWVGKPWCGRQGFYVDDRAVRPDEFANLTYEEICSLLSISADHY